MDYLESNTRKVKWTKCWGCKFLHICKTVSNNVCKSPGATFTMKYSYVKGSFNYDKCDHRDTVKTRTGMESEPLKLFEILLINIFPLVRHTKWERMKERIERGLWPFGIITNKEGLNSGMFKIVHTHANWYGPENGGAIQIIVSNMCYNYCVGHYENTIKFTNKDGRREINIKLVNWALKKMDNMIPTEKKVNK